MRNKAFLYLFVFLFLGAWAGCGGCFGSSEESTDSTEVQNEPADPGEDTPEGMPQDLGDALQGVFGGGDIKESVDFRKLKDLLPDDVAGLDRTNAEGSRNRFMGMELSQAQGRYEGDGSMTIEIVDLGTLAGPARFGYASWLQFEVDRESDSGFERTGKFRTGGKEYPSFHKFEGDGDRGSCEIQVWVAERFIVSVKGSNVEYEQCEEGRDEIKYGQLDRMKDEGTG